MKSEERIKKFYVALLLLSSFFLVCEGSSHNSFTIVAGKDATSDGSVMVAHNDGARNKNYYVNVHKISGRSNKGPGFLWLEVPGVEFGDTYMNENGVVITSNSCPSRESHPILSHSGIGFKLRRLVTEQATSARHAIGLAGKLIEKQGYSSSGRSYTVADPKEVWLLQVVKGKRWVAQRVPDDQMAVVSNRYTITTVNLADKENFMGSGDIVSYAKKRGWYKPKENEPFRFDLAYSAPRSLNHENNILRQWRATSLLAKKKFKINSILPFSFKPRKKVKLNDLFRVLRDHYEGTKYDLSRDYKEGTPNKTEKRTICQDSTRYSFVAQLRGDLPIQIGNVAWIAFRRPDSNSYSPWYFSVTAPPDGYSRGRRNGAYSSFAKLSELVDQKYRIRIKIARKEWRNFENYLLKMRNKMEKEFIYLIKKNPSLALKMITNYVWRMEYRKWFLASELVSQFDK